MRWASILLLMASLHAASGFGDSLDRALSTSSKLIESGQPAEALQLCRETQVEYPHSDTLLFAMGSAQCALGDRLVVDGAQRDAAAQFRDARTNFTRCAENSAVPLREGAAYNAATCLIRLDATFNPNAEYKERVENLGAAVEELAALVDAYPDNERARKNLDHVRYRLALLLQNPPQHEETPDEESNDDEPAAVSEVVDATTQLPNASAEVVDGSTVVLRFRSQAGDTP